MITVKVPSYEIYRISTRPAVLTSVKQMLDYFDINIDQKVFFNGEAEVSKLMGGEGNDKRGADTGVDFGYDNKLFIEFENNESEYNDALDTFTGDYSVPALWLDPITKSRIAPKFKTRRYDIIVNAYFKDRVTAQRYLTNIQSKALGMGYNSILSVQTHFPMIPTQMQCFKEIYDRLIAAKQVDPAVGFIDWMISNSTVPTGIIRNVIYNNPAFVFKQMFTDVGININNPTMARVNQGKFIGKYEVSFAYWFFWAEHIEWVMNYPIQVYQQPMPPEWIPDVFPDNKQEYAKRRFFEAAASYLIWDYGKHKAPFYQVFPAQDNWRPDPEYWVSPQLQVLVNVEDVERQVLINIKDINGFDWNQTVLDYILKYRTKVTNRHQNPITVKVWSSEGYESIPVLEEQILLEENGDLILTRSPRMSNIYRVVISFDYALRLYSEDCILDFLNNPDDARWILDLLFPFWPMPDGWGENGWADWTDTYNSIDFGGGDDIGFYMPYGMLSSLIIAHGSETYAQYQSLINKGVINGADYYRAGQATSGVGNRTTS